MYLEDLQVSLSRKISKDHRRDIEASRRVKTRHREAVQRPGRDARTPHTDHSDSRQAQSLR